MTSGVRADQVVAVVAGHVLRVAGGEPWPPGSAAERLYGLVVARAREVPAWSVAVRRLVDAPDDEAARESVVDVVVAMCAGDAGFAAAVGAALVEVGRSSHGVDVVIRNAIQDAVIGGPAIQAGMFSMTGGAIASGDVDQSRHRTVRVGMGGLLALVVAGPLLGGAAGYWTAVEQIADPGSAASQESPFVLVGVGGSPSQSRVVAERDAAVRILPDLDSVPSGWRLVQGTPKDVSCPPGCRDALVSVTTEYNPDALTDWVGMTVHTFGSVEDAKSGYSAVKDQLGSRTETWAARIADEQPSLSEVSASDHSRTTLQGTGGDEYEAITWYLELGRGLSSEEFRGISVVLRVGTVVATVDSLDSFSTADADVVRALARAVVDRAQQAQRGEMPSALVAGR
ncbi:hypothetical protein [Actinokineospora cianjurensis]|uniref:PknH-like protein n=1 Tax=Actinokineospora cianjurensis TaxID=585224 RepID=A0A421B2M0_9PSEU|nr:hypothetical protein [Actinokineospora cianjurensis]RLK58627.1 hypothetical protein CLV68_3098 [Actinokineospora cianjurensis]